MCNFTKNWYNTNGHQRFLRGELLSAHQWLTGLSVDLLLELLLLHNVIKQEATTDLLDLRRRIERLYLDLAANLNSIVVLHPGKIGFALMILAEDLLCSRVPTLGWNRFSIVKGWIADTLD